MPANLNALIRYKTINSCLMGGRRRWSIAELIDACSEALAESRGRYETISERTLRDDIRVMRSDILGFNAPIEQSKGLYYYSDPRYSIMSISISDSTLANQIIALLQELRTEVSHPELEVILDKLLLLSGPPQALTQSKLRRKITDFTVSYDADLPAILEESIDYTRERKLGSAASGRDQLTWGRVLEVIGKANGKG
jgi:hypothetical protein